MRILAKKFSWVKSSYKKLFTGQLPMNISLGQEIHARGRLQENTYLSASPLADLNIRGSALTGCKKKLALEVHLTCT